MSLLKRETTVPFVGTIEGEMVDLDLDALTFGRVEDLEDLEECIDEICRERFGDTPLFDYDDLIKFYGMLKDAGQVTSEA